MAGGTCTMTGRMRGTNLRRGTWGIVQSQQPAFAKRDRKPVTAEREEGQFGLTGEIKGKE